MNPIQIKSKAARIIKWVQIAWQHLSRQDEFDSVLGESHDRPVLIFKHSTRCIISTMVLRSLEAQADRLNPLGAWYYLDLIAHRDYSNLIAQELGINHESPQLIILHSGKVIWHESHQGITPEAVMGALSTGLGLSHQISGGKHLA